ncbi:hypothetical protein [Phytobacter sp. V91]|uniref:hypothetical protein n=1 Tax=Phytobacter sp. V91 TaxID=3369425 RepID=UPI003F5E24E9
MSDNKNLTNSTDSTGNSRPRLRVVKGSGFDAKLDYSSPGNQDGFTSLSYTKEEADMISREELDAKLAKNKSENDVIAAEMRREMAEFRTFQAQQFSTMNTAISEIKAQISGVNGEVTGLKGQIDGLKTTSSTLQWMVGAILALLAVMLAIPQVQSYLKPAEQPSSHPAATTSTPLPPPQDKK